MANRAQTLSLAILLILGSLALLLTQCGDETTGPKNTPPDTPSSPSGPVTGVTDTSYQFSSSATDPDGDKVAIRFAWGDGDTSDWSSFVSSGEVVSMAHAWDSTGTYDVRAQAKDSRGATSSWSAPHHIVISSIPNNAPDTPSTPSGPATGLTDTLYQFSCSATDPDGDKVAIRFAWGDGDTSDWSSFVSSGEVASMSHAWDSTGTYDVRAQAKDSRGATSGWSAPHPIAISPTLGSLKWTYTIGDAVYSSPAIGSDGTIYVGSNDYNLYAINPDGSLKWTYTTRGWVESSPAIGSDGTIYVYVSSQYGKLYAINPDGSLKWTYTVYGTHWPYPSPAIGSDGTIYVGSNDYNLYAINPDGSLKWTFATGDAIFSSPAIGSDGTVYVRSYDGTLYAISPGCFLHLEWTYTTGIFLYSSPAVGSDGTIYVGSYDNNLYAINSDGSLKWIYTTGGPVDSSPAIGSDGTIYVGSWDGNLYAINPDGSLKWTYTTGATVRSSPALGSDGTIYVGSAFDLYAINPDGSLKWVYTTIGGLDYSSPAIGPDGTIYVTSQDGKLYAIQGTGRLASSPWPMFRHDLRHSGRSGGP